jgi:hypothetical protein
MQMLGLTIQKVSYAQKNKKNSCFDIALDNVSLGLTPEILSFQNT